MATDTCTKCGAKVAPSDVQCLDCGADLVAARRRLQQELQEQSLAGRTGAADGPKVAVANLASAGKAAPGESSKDTRLKVFDEYAVKMLQHEALASLVLAIPAALVALGLAGWAVQRLRALGWAELSSLRLGDLQSFGGLADPRLLTVVLAGMGLGGLLAALGLFIRVFTARQAVRDVRAGEKPELVGLNLPLYLGLLCLAVFCPPAGLLVGIILRFSADSDIAGAAGLMLKLSLLVILLLLGNMLYGLLAQWLAARVPAAGNGAGAAPAAGL